MRTAIVSDLHLGTMVSVDLAREPELGGALVKELAGADRVVLLGDVLELRDRPAGEILELARPFLEQLGDALEGREIVLVPGNHDHRLAEPLLDRRSLGRPKKLSLEQRFKPAPGVGAQVSRLLRPAQLSLAYPGYWVRDDVWLTHGHYLDCHMAVPTIECLSAAATMRMVGAIPERAAPEDYERAIGPMYGFSWGFAQARGPERIGGRARPSSAVWRRLNGDRSGRLAARFLGSVAFPLAVRGLGRALGRQFVTDISAEGISRAGLAAIGETVRRLGVEADHVVFGHTHRPGPLEGEENALEWVVSGAPHLHSAGSWTYSPGLCGPTPEQSLFWPGTVTWVGESGPPERKELLHDRTRADLARTIEELALSARAQAAG